MWTDWFYIRKHLYLKKVVTFFSLKWLTLLSTQKFMATVKYNGYYLLLPATLILYAENVYTHTNITYKYRGSMENIPASLF